MVPTPPEPPKTDSFQRELDRVFTPEEATHTTTQWWAERNRSEASLAETPITRREAAGTLAPPPRPPGDLKTAIAALEGEAPTIERVHELASRLSSRAAWEQGGPEIVSWLLAHDARAELLELATLVYAYAPADGEPPPIALAMHEAFGRALLDDLELGRRTPAAIHALVALDLPARLGPRIHRLAEHAEGPEGTLLRGLLRRTRRARAAKASLDALVAAIHLLARS